MELTKKSLIDEQIKTIEAQMAQLNSSGKHGSKKYLVWQNILASIQKKSEHHA